MKLFLYIRCVLILQKQKLCNSAFYFKIATVRIDWEYYSSCCDLLISKQKKLTVGHKSSGLLYHFRSNSLFEHCYDLRNPTVPKRQVLSQGTGSQGSEDLNSKQILVEFRNQVISRRRTAFFFLSINLIGFFYGHIARFFLGL